MNGTGSVTYKGIDLMVDYYATPYVPEVWFEDNGDPGSPAEGGDFEIEAVRVNDTDITDLLSPRVIEEIEQAYCNENY